MQAAFLPAGVLRRGHDAGGIAVLLAAAAGRRRRRAAVARRARRPDRHGRQGRRARALRPRAHPETDEPRLDRDAWEDALLSAARSTRGLPFLGICRGAQVLNVARGGTLHQHLPEALGTDRYRVGGGVFSDNEVAVDAGHELAALVGDRARSTCTATTTRRSTDSGDGLVVTARTDDGIDAGRRARRACRSGSGAVASRGGRRDDLRLFAGLVSAATKHAAERTTGARHEQHSRSSTRPTETAIRERRAHDARARWMTRSRARVAAQRRGQRSPPPARAEALRRFRARSSTPHVEELAQLEVLQLRASRSRQARWEAGHVATC